MFTLETPVPETTDRRVARSQQLIRDAFRSLLEERDFETLTVQQIIDRANVGRATFYAHFDSKADLLASNFDELRTALRTRQREALAAGGAVDDRVFAFSVDLFAHANEYRDVFRGMRDKQTGIAVQRLLHKLMLDLLRGDVKAATGRRKRAAPDEAVVQFLAGAMFGLLMWWMEARVPVTVAEIDGLFRRLALPALRAASA